MQVFIPYPQPIKVAKCLDKRRLNKQIIECHQIMAAAKGKTKAWANHPVVKMYRGHLEWLEYYTNCLESYRAGQIELSIKYSREAELWRPEWMTQTICNAHKRRLVAKDPKFYKDFCIYGISEINYYIIDNMVWGYARGKSRFSITLEEFQNIRFETL